MGVALPVQTSLVVPSVFVRRTRYDNVDDPGNDTFGHFTRTDEPSTPTVGVGETEGVNAPTENALPNPEECEENRAVVRAGVMNATITKVATRAPQPRFTC